MLIQNTDEQYIATWLIVDLCEESGQRSKDASF